MNIYLPIYLSTMVVIYYGRYKSDAMEVITLVNECL